MRVGLSLLTLVPGEVGGAETSARGLARGLAEVGTLDYVAFTPPAAPGAGEGLPETPVPEYRDARSIRERLFAMTLADDPPGPAARALRRPRRRPLPAHDRAAAARPADGRDACTTSSTSTTRSSSRAPSALWRARTHERSARNADAVIVDEPVRPPPRDRAARAAAGARPCDPAGCRPRALPPRDARSASPFLLYPARPWPHKNHARLFEAFALLREERPELRLVLTGGGHEGRAVPPGVEVRGLVSGRGARLALPAHRLPRLPEPLRGLRPASARGDGVWRAGRGVEHPGDRRGRR